MSTKKKSVSKSRRRHSQAFKDEALKLAATVGVTQAARQLGVYESQIYQWRSKSQAVKNRSAREEELAAENAKLKRQLAQRNEEVAILKKASAYFAANQR